MKNKKKFSVPVTVEFEDVDSYKIAHHTKMVAYLERARLRFLGELGFEIHPKGLSIVMYNLEMRFKATAKIMDKLTIETMIKSYDDYRIDLFSRIMRDDRILVRATVGIAFMDETSEQIVPIPDKLITAIQEYL